MSPAQGKEQRQGKKGEANAEALKNARQAIRQSEETQALTLVDLRDERDDLDKTEKGMSNINQTTSRVESSLTRLEKSKFWFLCGGCLRTCKDTRHNLHSQKAGFGKMNDNNKICSRSGNNYCSQDHGAVENRTREPEGRISSKLANKYADAEEIAGLRSAMGNIRQGRREMCDEIRIQNSALETMNDNVDSLDHRIVSCTKRVQKLLNK